MLDDSNTTGQSSNWSVLLFVIVLVLIIFPMFTGGGMWGNNRGGTPMTFDHHRDTLKTQTSLAQSEKETQNMLSSALQTLTAQNDANMQKVLDGQKDLYIKQLEQQGFQLYVNSQNEATRNLLLQQTNTITSDMNSKFSQLAYQSLADKSSTDAAIASIGYTMIKRPEVQACCGLPSLSCTNTGCGCSS